MNPAAEPIFVAAAAAASALGDTLEAIWPRLLAGETAIGPVRRFDTSRLECHNAACAPGLEDGPTDNLICNLMGRCLAGLPPLPPGTFVIWAGVKGDAQYIEQTQAGQTPTACCLPRHYRQWVGAALGHDGPGLEINAACASSTVALALGAQMIRQGEAASVLVCAADVVSRFTFTGFSSLRGVSRATCRPFDAQRDGLCLGDGAGAILLAGEKALKSLSAPPLARLTGWGIANDATHITAPARDGCGLIAAIEAALDRAGLAPEAVQAYCAHGTATLYNDAMELTALEQVFGERRFPLFSVKGALGHTLGAAGTLESALCLKALAERRVPPTTGLQNPEPRAEGRALDRPQPFAGGNVLKTNSGFGGINAAALFEAVD